MSIEDDLRDSREVAFQAALLYTSSKGERRIRVHTFCLPTTASVTDVINSADQQAIVGMLAKFGRKDHNVILCIPQCLLSAFFQLLIAPSTTLWLTPKKVLSYPAWTPSKPTNHTPGTSYPHSTVFFLSY